MCVFLLFINTVPKQVVSLSLSLRRVSLPRGPWLHPPKFSGRSRAVLLCGLITFIVEQCGLSCRVRCWFDPTNLPGLVTFTLPVITIFSRLSLRAMWSNFIQVSSVGRWYIAFFVILSCLIILFMRRLCTWNTENPSPTPHLDRINALKHVIRSLIMINLLLKMNCKTVPNELRCYYMKSPH